MLFFLMNPVVMHGGLLVAAAAIPAVFLMIKVYRSDRLEKESPYLIKKLIWAGLFSVLLALVEETVLSFILGLFVPVESPLYNIIMFFVIVAFSEETSKFLFMYRKTWRNPEFNCQYDGVVYAVITSLSFALFENITYVFSYGFGTAVIRAVTAIPGHACFGVFMGVFYGIAKRCDYRRSVSGSSFFRYMAILVPALLHGAYDYIATMEADSGDWSFLVFIIIMFIISYILIGKQAKKDRPINY
jgi:RsiW-degrading membrane proteinase PrsW (M82 family)